MVTTTSFIDHKFDTFTDDETADIVRRLSALSEPAALDYFWTVGQRWEHRLALLLQFGRVQMARPVTWSPKAVREEFERTRTRACAYKHRLCFGCYGSQKRLYSHHVIEVYHGGSNSLRNLVPLCFQCHQFLHPWLKDEPAPRPTPGPEMAGLILPRVIAEDVLDAIDRGESEPVRQP